MMQVRRIAGATLVYTACMLAGFQNAWAEVTISDQVLQSGKFAKPDCKPENATEGFDECSCVADIHYPAITGLADAEKQKQLNGVFRSKAEALKCEGKESDAEAKGEPASSNYNFEASYQSPKLLGLRLENWMYTGGAHGNGTVEGAVIDLEQGKILALTDIFKDLQGLNKFIYDALSAEPEGEVFHDSIEAFKGVFVTDKECKSCTVLLTSEGVKVVFQTYAVSSFANGPMEVQIPEKFIAYPSLIDAVKNAKPSTPEPEKK